jgi:hypothetical protein
VALISEAQESDWYKLLPQSHIPGVNHSLFVMMLKDVVSMETEEQPRAAPAAAPLLSDRGETTCQTKLVVGGQQSRTVKNSMGHSNTRVYLQLGPLPPESQRPPYPFLPHSEPSPSISLHHRQVPNPSLRDPSSSTSGSTPTGHREFFLSIHALPRAWALPPNPWCRLGSTLKSMPSAGIPNPLDTL